MAELELVSGGSMAGPVQALGRWGILRLLPQWLSDQVAAGGRREQAIVAAPGQTIAPRAAAAALRRTIDAWRAAEHDLEALEMGSAARASLQAEIDSLRAAHHRLFLEVSRPGRSEAVEKPFG